MRILNISIILLLIVNVSFAQKKKKEKIYDIGKFDKVKIYEGGCLDKIERGMMTENERLKKVIDCQKNAHLSKKGTLEFKVKMSKDDLREEILLENGFNIKWNRWIHVGFYRSENSRKRHAKITIYNHVDGNKLRNLKDDLKDDVHNIKNVIVTLSFEGFIPTDNGGYDNVFSVKNINIYTDKHTYLYTYKGGEVNEYNMSLKQGGVLDFKIDNKK